MRTIQEVGQEILTNKPQKFYIFCGTEYGIKQKYLEILTKHYNDNVSELPSMSAIFALFSRKRMMPLSPALYIIRYDADFLADCDTKTQAKIDALKIIGTVVCLYEDAKHASKVTKYLSDYAVVIDPVDSKYLKKYLTTEFPRLTEFCINNVLSVTSDYNTARLVCRSLIELSPEDISGLTPDKIIQLFDIPTIPSDQLLKQGIASRNFKYLVKVIDDMDDCSEFFFAVFSVCIELEKLLTQTYQTSSYLKSYVSNWTIPDVTNIYNITYNQLKQARQTSSNLRDCAYFIAANLQYHF